MEGTSDDQDRAILVESAKELREAFALLQDGLTSQKKELSDMKKQLHRQRKELKKLRREKKAVSKENKLARRLLEVALRANTGRDNLPGLGETSRETPPLLKFDRFSELPTEIRMAIWKAALPAGRLFEPFFGPTSHRPSSVSNATTFTIRLNSLPQLDQHGNVVAHNQGGRLATQIQSPSAPPWPFNARHDPPTLRCQTAFAASEVRFACREAYRAAAEVGRFEFGLFQSQRRGHWFNHAFDMVKITTDLVADLNFLAMDLSRIRRLAFGRTQFLTEQNVTAILDVIMLAAPRCHNVVFLFEHEPRGNYRRDGISQYKTHTYALVDGDVIGNHAFPAARNLGNDPITWRQLRHVVEVIWGEHISNRGYNPFRMPHISALEVLRGGKLPLAEAF